MKKKPLSVYRPELAAQLHPTKNPDISADTISVKHNRKVWWVCEKGHEWEEKVSSRVRQLKVDCKICGSLACTYPQIAMELHPTLNGDLKAEDLTPFSKRKVQWLCPEGHEYEATVGNRTGNESGCPYCTGKRITDTRSLSFTHPELAKRFHPTKNGVLTTDSITSNYLKSVWWVCEKGHEWQETVQNCSRQKTLKCPECRSLGYLRPALLAEYHPDNGYSPYAIPANSNEKVKWKCQTCSHVWMSTVANRFRGSGCPGCSGAEATTKTSVAALSPDVAKEWDYSANEKRPEDFTIGSTEIVSWICPNGHSYKESIYDRTTRKRGCPTCKTVAFLCPHLLEEWSEENDLSPHEEFAGTDKEVIWICKKCEHKWSAKIVARYHGSGCPNCNSGWTVENIRRFVQSLLPYLNTLTPAALYVLFQQKGLLSMAKDAKGRSFVEALKTGKFPVEELQKFSQGEASIVDEFLANPGLSIEQIEELDLDSIEAKISEDRASLDRDLPTVETKDILAAIDSKLFSNHDTEAIDFFIKEAVARIWQHAFADEEKALRQLHQYDSKGLYPQEVRNLFIGEYSGAKSLEIPPGYSFSFQPNLMQRYTAFLVKSRRRIGNWSGTGAGKTLSAILASRVIESKVTIIFCPNNVVENWKRNINEIYPDSFVLVKSTSLKKEIGACPAYLILNYEFFQQPGAKSKLKSLLTHHKIDFVIIDEIHFSRQRVVDRMSLRKEVVSAFLSEASSMNNEMRILGMSATPVINNLYEGKTLIELVTGIYHEDLKTIATVQNCIAMYQKFVSHGIRWLPAYKYKLNVVTEDLDCSQFLEEIKAQSLTGSMVDLEATLARAKIPFILTNLKPKTVVYTHYIKGILPFLQEAIEHQGWKVAIFTGESKEGLEAFITGDADILIASSCVGTGIDRLQLVSNRLIVASLPWTHAEFEQLKGRFYRQGQRQDHVDVFVPLTFAFLSGERWSWCDSRWKRIQFKKSISDAAVDGVIPEGHLRTPGQAYKDTMKWLERLERGEVFEIKRERIIIPLLSDLERSAKRKLGTLSEMNGRINKLSSSQAHNHFSKNPEEWVEYHATYRNDRINWPVVPYQEAIKWIKARPPHLVIGDFGCGEAFLAAELENKIHSFDHIAINEEVIACDLAHVPLDEGCLDVSVFSLSLMGSNFIDYLLEAHRCLKLDGHLWIAEPTSRISDISKFEDLLFRLGFDVVRVEKKWKFTFVKAIKSEREINRVSLGLIEPKDVLS